MIEEKQDDIVDITRRNVLKSGGYLAAGGLLLPALTMPAEAGFFSSKNFKSGEREIAFRNTHTGESFSGVYRVGDKYLPDAFDQINIVLRDFRTDEVFPIDPRILDVIYTVHDMTDTKEPYDIISGYRSPKTNAMLRKNTNGVARKSLHMTGQAIDLRLPGFSTKQLKKIAVGLKAGGVGFYSGSDFVHIDTGKVRSW